MGREEMGGFTSMLIRALKVQVCRQCQPLST